MGKQGSRLPQILRTGHIYWTYMERLLNVSVYSLKTNWELSLCLNLAKSMVFLSQAADKPVYQT